MIPHPKATNLMSASMSTSLRTLAPRNAQARVTLSFSPPFPTYTITEEAEMPIIVANALLVDFVRQPNDIVRFSWSATVQFSGCSKSSGRKTRHVDMTQETQAGIWVIPFSQVRGGELSVKVRVTCRDQMAQSEATLTIHGKNPTVHTLSKIKYPDPVFKQVMRQESNLLQFAFANPGEISKCPYFGGTGGDVGICQLSRLPRQPTDDEVWDWKANVAEGIRRWEQHGREARDFPKVREGSEQFKQLVEEYNRLRVAEKQRPLRQIHLPAFDRNQLLLDTIRGYNGWGGRGARGVHEFEPATDSAGHLIVTVDPSGNQGTASWMRITADERQRRYEQMGIPDSRWGDLDYVNRVLSRRGF